MEIFKNAEIGEKFKRQEIDGQMLLQSERILQDKSIEVLGLDTIGKKDKFTSSVAKLRGMYAYCLTWGNFFRKRFKARVNLLKSN